MQKIRKIRSDRKGINTILAALLMVVIVVVASVMVYAWSTGLLGSLLVQPNVGKETLQPDAPAAFSSGTNVTIYIRNSGTIPVTLQSYYVKDSTGDAYQLTSWSGPSINPNAVNPTAFTIGSSCSSCVLTGTAFTFQPGYQYTVLVITSRNNQFTFTATR
jgi:flagellin-like protein